MMEQVKNILVEASGSPVSAYLISAIKRAGHRAVASDISADCSGAYLADDFMLVPKHNDPELWQHIDLGLFEHKIDYVIPSFDRTLQGWAKRKQSFGERGVSVLISPEETINILSDKWNSYCFFKQHNIPCAATSLSPEYPVLKPRSGSGASGFQIQYDDDKRRRSFDQSLISQEVMYGTEYTVDCLFGFDGTPIYIIPRRRINVSSGKSLEGITINHREVIQLVERVAKKIKFIGPTNFQFFDNEGDIKIIEINSRIAGGGALGFAASENWVPLMLKICEGENIEPKGIRWGVKMMRYFSETFSEKGIALDND